ncbi:hypothetical protein ACIQ9Q_33765 [Streptomyces sp. NPDC094438]|uniref:hypothetical protein n=1 Tax=Streptomyces sp. NPDC094438 TaxID=3366061 RepID=UPI00380B52B2
MKQKWGCRSVMRAPVRVIVVRVVFFGLAVVGAVCTVLGVAHVRSWGWDFNDTIQFAHAGDYCDETTGGGMVLDVGSGDPVECGLSMAMSRAGPHSDRAFNAFSGLSRARNSQVLALAARLGTDGLSPADQKTLQDRVDAIRARQPPPGPPWALAMAHGGPVLVIATLLLASPAADFVEDCGRTG